MQQTATTTGHYAVGYKKTAFAYDASRLTTLTDWTATYTDPFRTGENLTYTYDHDAQLTSAAAPYGGYGGGLAGGTYSWDGNGDTTLSGHVTGKGNRLLNDGTYRYVYDKSGHMTQRFSSTSETDFSWDNRGRMTSVKSYTKSGSTLTQTQQVDLWYDAFNRLIGRVLTPYTSGSPNTSAIVSTRFVYDGDAAALAFTGNQSLTDRYLWGPAVDQILADERFAPTGSNQMPSSAGTTYWALGDNEWSVRDWITYGSLVDHVVYDSFGKVYSQTSTAVPFNFGHNGVFYDPATGLEYHSQSSTGLPGRWYNPAIQRWMSEDPKGLGPDSNPFRYCGNSPTNFVDSSGLAPSKQCTNADRGKSVIHINNTSITSLAVEFTNMKGNALPYPLLSGGPQFMKAAGQAALKTMLYKFLLDLEQEFIKDVLGKVAKALKAEFAGIDAAQELTMTKVTAVMHVSVETTVTTGVADTERRWYTLGCYQHDLGTSHWETETKTFSLDIPVGEVNLVQMQPPGIMVNDDVGLSRALTKLRQMIEQNITNANNLITRYLTDPNTTVDPITQ